MSGNLFLLQLLWIAVLAMVLLGFSSPWPAGINLLLAVLVLVAASLAAIALIRRRLARRRSAAATLGSVDSTLGALPGVLKKHLPLLLTIGDPQSMRRIWGEDIVRVTESAIWVHGQSPASLMHLADALQRWRDGQGPDAVFLLLSVDQNPADLDLATAWRPWRSALTASGKMLGYTLPVGVAVYLLSSASEGNASPWFGISAATPLPFSALATLLAPRLDQFVRAAAKAQIAPHARQAALLHAAIRWGGHALLPILAGGRVPWQVTAFGVITMPGAPLSDSWFNRHVATATGLLRAGGDHAAGTAHYPLPDPLVAGLPRQPIRHGWPRALAYATISLALFSAVGAMASGWQNRSLIQRMAAHTSQYAAIASDHDAARIDALTTLKQDRDELERYADLGVPMRLGFGLYRGAPWLLLTRQLIASYQPPPAPPSMIELDSMALFNSGSAILNPGSNRLLVGALEMIKLHADKRVLVAGYTDSSGDPASNLRLSQARAASVRDWLLDASGVAPTRFAIQGYGDSHPKASNYSEVGRAANRRVEITLIPDCRALHDSHSTEGQTACF